MRKTLLFFFLCFVSLTFAQGLKKTVSFDFQRPQTLSPAVTPGTNIGDKIFLRNQQFKSGPITLTLYQKDLSNGVVALQTERNYTCLYFTRGVDIIIESEDADLLTVFIPDGIGRGDLSLVPGEPGQFIAETDGAYWKNGSSDGVRRIVLRNFGVDGYIEKMHVTYSMPLNNITSADFSPAQGSVNPKVDMITAQFNDNITLKSAQSIQITNTKTNQQIAATPSVSGNVLTLTPASPLDKDGVYTFTLPTHFIETEEGCYNQEISYSCEVVEPRNTFSYTTIAPSAGVVQVIGKNEITLTFPTQIGYVDESKRAKIYKRRPDGSVYREATITRSQDGYSATLSFVNDYDDITEKDLYTLKIEEGTIWNNLYDNTKDDNGESLGARYNPAIELVYNVGNVEAPSAAKLAEANAWLQKTGVGTPKATSTARTTLAQMVADENDGDAAMTIAIDNFIKDSDIELPATGKNYKISFVNASGAKAYLCNDYQKVYLSNNADDACSFLLTVNADNTVTLKTVDGKYLHVPMNTPLYGSSETVARNVTDFYNASVNNLSVEKLIVDGMAADKLFGVMCLKGGMGNKLGVDQQGYALVKVDDLTISTNPSIPSGFFVDNTNGISFEEVSAPIIKIPEAKYSLDPDNGTEVQTLENVIVTFPEIANVSVVADAAQKISVNASDGKTTKPASVTLVEGTTNSYSIAINGLPSGETTVSIPEGVFTYQFLETPATVQAISATYIVRKGDDFIYDFNGMEINGWNHYVYQTENYAVVDATAAELNNKITYYTLPVLSNFPKGYEIGIDPNAKVALWEWPNKIVAYGHLEKATKAEVDGKSDYGVKLVYDEDLTTLLEAGRRYAFVIPAGAFGDKNFAQYLADPSKVARSQCHVIDVTRLYVDVIAAHQQQATGISLDKTSLEMTVGQKAQLTATVLPADLGIGVTWGTSDAAVALVSPNGEITANGAGTVTITATTKDGSRLKATCTVTVKSDKATKLEINPNKIENANIDDEFTLTAVADVDGVAVEWSVDNSEVAVVDQNGKVKAVGAGTAIIKAHSTDGTNLTAYCEITVKKTLAKTLTIDPQTIDARVGDNIQITATTDVEGVGVEWSIDKPAIATIDQTGKITAIAEGVAIITAKTTDGSFLTAHGEITVKKAVAKVLKISPKTIPEAYVGDVFTITAETDIEGVGIEWSVNNPAVATIDQTGKLTALAEGRTIFTAKATDGSNIEAYGEIIVKKKIAKEIHIDQPVLDDVTVDSEIQLNVTTDAPDVKIVWETDDPKVAVVDKNGKVTIVGPGTTVITAYLMDGSGLCVTCTITAVKPVVYSLTLSSEVVTLEKGEQLQLTAVLKADDEVIDAGTVKWETSDDDVVVVNKSGKVSCFSKGTATVTATVTAPDGKEYTAQCVFTCTDDVRDIQSDGDKDVIYDMSGRKLDKVTRSGLYIINGKKVMKR